jgi:hypothetical protein
MTKRELLARLVHEPIVIEPLGAGYHRIALHADRDPRNGVWIALVSSTGTAVVEDRRASYVSVDGRRMRMTGRELESVIARLRLFFTFSD